MSTISVISGLMTAAQTQEETLLFYKCDVCQSESDN